MNTVAETSAENLPNQNVARCLKDLISQQPFLRGLSEEHLQILANCAMLQEFTAGEHIFREGDLANRFYLILEGNVVLESREREEDPVTIEAIGAGDELGWSWLFPPYYWHFDARVMKPTKAIFFYGTRLRDHCEKNPALGYELMKRMTEIVIKRLQATRKQWLALRQDCRK